MLHPHCRSGDQVQRFSLYFLHVRWLNKAHYFSTLFAVLFSVSPTLCFSTSPLFSSGDESIHLREQGISSEVSLCFPQSLGTGSPVGLPSSCSSSDPSSPLSSFASWAAVHRAPFPFHHRPPAWKATPKCSHNSYHCHLESQNQEIPSWL